MSWQVGQEVWRHDVNERRGGGGPQRVTITKVGRKLITIERHGRPEQFRIDTGRSNDACGHGSLCTDEQHAAHIERTAITKRLDDVGVRFEFGWTQRYDNATLARVADVLEEASR